MTQETGKMELVTTDTCMASDIGVNSNMFGGRMMALIDKAAGAYAAQICDSPKMVTVIVDKLIFKHPVRIGNIIKTYVKVLSFGRTSVTLYLEVRKHNVRTGEQEVMVHTDIKFVQIDEDNRPLPLAEQVKTRYAERVQKYGRGLISIEEKESEDSQVK